MEKTAGLLARLGVPPEGGAPPSSPRRFPDGAQYRLEVPSVENSESLSKPGAKDLGVPEC